MTLVVPNIAEVTLLKFIVNKADNSDLVLRLFDNDITPGEGTGDTTDAPSETTASGYAAQTLTGSSWTVSTALSGTSTAQYPPVTFTITEDASIYGYYVTNGSDLCWVERFSGAPFELPVSGGTITITPKLSLA